MFHFFKNLLGLFKDLIHFIEILFLAFVFLRTVHSLSLGIIIFIILLVASFFFHNISKAVAWGILGFLLTLNFNPNDIVFSAFMAVLFGGVRYLIGHGFNFFKK
ncbi:MAG: hypothetical protein WBZ33_08285 [Thermoactinomyces sp.]